MVRLAWLPLAVYLALVHPTGGAAEPDAARAHRGAPALAGRPIDAVNFDNGGPDVSFHVADPNHASVYRDTPVRIQPRGSHGYSVAHTSASDWLAYTLRAPHTGYYVFSATCANEHPGAQFHVCFDGTDRTGPLDVPQSGDPADWNTVASRPFRLSAGNHVMRLCLDRNANGSADAGRFDTLFVTPIRPGVTLSWSPAADAPVPRFECVGRVVRGKLYTFGGFTSVVPYAVSDRASVYDPATGQWTDLGLMPVPQTHSGVAVDEAKGRIVFLGGRRGAYPGVASSEVWEYDTAANAWSPLAPLPDAYSAGGAEFLNGQIHYVGGNRGNDRATDYDEHLVLNPGETSWHKAAPLPFPRDHFSVALLGGKMYVFGGEVGHDARHRQRTDACVYDPSTDAWSSLAAMPIGKSHAEAGTFVLDGRVIISGGQIDNFQATNNIVEYDPAADAWSLLPTLPLPLEGVTVQPLGNRLFATGGYIGSHSRATTASYTSTVFTGPPNSRVGLVPRVVLPVEAAMMATLGSALAVVRVRRRRKLRQDN